MGMGERENQRAAVTSDQALSSHSNKLRQTTKPAQPHHRPSVVLPFLGLDNLRRNHD